MGARDKFEQQHQVEQAAENKEEQSPVSYLAEKKHRLELLQHRLELMRNSLSTDIQKEKLSEDEQSKEGIAEYETRKQEEHQANLKKLGALFEEFEKDLERLRIRTIEDIQQSGKYKDKEEVTQYTKSEKEREETASANEAYIKKLVSLGVDLPPNTDVTDIDTLSRAIEQRIDTVEAEEYLANERIDLYEDQETREQISQVLESTQEDATGRGHDSLYRELSQKIEQEGVPENIAREVFRTKVIEGVTDSMEEPCLSENGVLLSTAETEVNKVEGYPERLKETQEKAEEVKDQLQELSTEVEEALENDTLPKGVKDIIEQQKKATGGIEEAVMFYFARLEPEVYNQIVNYEDPGTRDVSDLNTMLHTERTRIALDRMEDSMPFLWGLVFNSKQDTTEQDIKTRMNEHENKKQMLVMYGSPPKEDFDVIRTMESTGMTFEEIEAKIEEKRDEFEEEKYKQKKQAELAADATWLEKRYDALKLKSEYNDAVEQKERNKKKKEKLVNFETQHADVLDKQIIPKPNFRHDTIDWFFVDQYKQYEDLAQQLENTMSFVDGKRLEKEKHETKKPKKETNLFGQTTKQMKKWEETRQRIATAYENLLQKQKELEEKKDQFDLNNAKIDSTLYEALEDNDLLGNLDDNKDKDITLGQIVENEKQRIDELLENARQTLKDNKPIVEEYHALQKSLDKFNPDFE